MVHNTYVVGCLKEKGAIFIEDLSDVPDNATLIFSAHGVPRAVQDEARRRQLKVFDATCPLVTKVHLEVARHAHKGDDVILIGHAGHPEVEGTMGQYSDDRGGQIYLVENEQDAKTIAVNRPEQLAYVTQTTLSVDDSIAIIDLLRQRFPGIQGPRKDDICYATQNRQDAVKKLAADCDLMLVVGSVNSSNSNRLRELAEKLDTPSYLVDDSDHLDKRWFENKTRIGITAGASAPEVLVKDVISRLKQWFGASLSEDSGPREQIVFQLPKELR